MVGLEAAVAYADEIERQLGRVEQMARRMSSRPARSSIARAGSSRYS